MSARSAAVAARSFRPLVVVSVLATACLAVFGVAAALLSAPKAPDPLMRWSPPVRDPLPAAVAGRDPLPFCGVAQGGDEAFVYRCMEQAVDAREGAEAGIIGTSDFGQRIQILRVLPNGTAELYVLGDLETEGHDGWLLLTCTSVVVDQDPRFVVRPDGCGPANPV